jgi:hypothetical protein
MSARDRANAQRQQLAYESARIMAEQGISNYDRARRKAAERAGISDRRSWPSNELIQDALIAQRRLFRGQEHVRELDRMRCDALEAMRIFADFAPHLVGPVLCGAGDVRDGVQLHLFADRPEDVMLRLMDRRIPYRERDRVLRYARGERRAHPAFRFVAGDVPFELIVLPTRALRNPPLDPVSERPERGADLAAVKRLIAGAEGQDGGCPGAHLPAEKNSQVPPA